MAIDEFNLITGISVSIISFKVFNFFPIFPPGWSSLNDFLSNFLKLKTEQQRASPNAKDIVVEVVGIILNLSASLWAGKIKFISDGQFITTYDEDLEQAIIQNYGNKFKENIIDVMTDELLIKEKFSLKHYIEERDHHIKFLPIKSDIENNVFLLVIHDGKIKEISFVNDFEQSVIMKFENFKKNVRILDSSFKINIPKNFDVIVDK